MRRRVKLNYRSPNKLDSAFWWHSLCRSHSARTKNIKNRRIEKKVSVRGHRDVYGEWVCDAFAGVYYTLARPRGVNWNGFCFKVKSRVEMKKKNVTLNKSLLLRWTNIRNDPSGGIRTHTIYNRRRCRPPRKDKNPFFTPRLFLLLFYFFFCIFICSSRSTLSYCSTHSHSLARSLAPCKCFVRFNFFFLYPYCTFFRSFFFFFNSIFSLLFQMLDTANACQKFELMEWIEWMHGASEWRVEFREDFVTRTRHRWSEHNSMAWERERGEKQSEVLLI